MADKPTCTPEFEEQALDEWASKIAEKCTDNGDGTFSLQLDGEHHMDGDMFNRIWSKLFDDNGLPRSTKGKGDEW